MILVTGATGNLGMAVINHLLRSMTTEKFAGLARSEEKAEALRSKNVQVRIGDFDDISSVERAFEGVEKLLLISSMSHDRAAQQKAVIDVAGKAGIKHIVYTGVAMKDVGTAATRFLMESHFQTEDHIKKSELTYTFLRNSLYTDVIPMYAGKNVLETGIYFASGNGRSPYALRREMGEAAAKVLLQSGHENKTYELTGSELYSYADIAAALSELSGREVPFVDADEKEFSEKLKQAGLPEFAVSVFSAFAKDLKNHQLEIVTEDLQKLLGRKPAALKEALKEIYGF